MIEEKVEKNICYLQGTSFTFCFLTAWHSLANLMQVLAR